MHASIGMTLTILCLLLNMYYLGQVWWYTPVIPELWEAEAQGSQIQDQPGQLSVLVRPCQKKSSKF